MPLFFGQFAMLRNGPDSLVVQVAVSGRVGGSDFGRNFTHEQLPARMTAFFAFGALDQRGSRFAIAVIWLPDFAVDLPVKPRGSSFIFSIRGRGHWRELAIGEAVLEAEGRWCRVDSLSVVVVRAQRSAGTGEER